MGIKTKERRIMIDDVVFLLSFWMISCTAMISHREGEGKTYIKGGEEERFSYSSFAFGRAQAWCRDRDKRREQMMRSLHTFLEMNGRGRG